MSRIGEILGAGAWRRDDPAPLYMQLQEHIRLAITRGTLRPQDALPGERDIAEAFSVSRVTVRKALAGLIGEGLLKQRQGSGTFVSAPPRRVEQGLSRLTSFSQDMRVRGLAPTSRWLAREVSLPSPGEAMRLSLSPSETICRFKRLRLADDVPMAIDLAVVATRYLPDPALIAASFYEALEAGGFLPVRALQRLSAANLEPEEAALLGVGAGAAALYIERLSYLKSGVPVEFTQSWYRGDAYDFVAELNLRQE